VDIRPAGRDYLRGSKEDYITQVDQQFLKLFFCLGTIRRLSIIRI
jgi:hypothetical protein